jgi:hypothetical protein
LDKGKAKEKFLDSIKMDNENKSTSSETNKIAPILKPIMERFPNLSQETLEKLSTPEGLRNRHKILQNLPDNELKTDITPFKTLSNIDKNKFDKILKETMHLDSEAVTDRLKEEFPEVDLSTDNYRNEFIKAVEEEINSGKTEEERDKIRKEFANIDLLEIQNTGGTSDIKTIRNVIRENYTHNSLLKEIKNKGKDTSFEELIKDVKTLKTDQAFELFKDLESSENSKLIDSILSDNIDNTMEQLIKENPSANKQELIEKLIQDKPLHKDKILEKISRTVDKQIKHLEENLDENSIRKMRRVLTREDLKERESLSENRTIEQIQALNAINRSQSSLLNQIKSKANQMSVNNPSYPNQISNISQEPSSSYNQSSNTDNKSSFNTTTHLEDTMNLFD